MTNRDIPLVARRLVRASVRRRRGARALAIGAAVAALLPSIAHAETADDNWQVRAVIYAYLPSISGTTRFPSDTGSSVNIDANDVVGSLKFAFMGAIEAQRGAWGGFLDVMYLNVGATRSETRDVEIGGGALPAGITTNAHLNVKGSVWTAAGSYRLVSTPAHTLDALAGVRGLNVTEKLDWSFSADVGPFVGPGRQGSSEARKENWDGIIGVKGIARLGDDLKWFVPYYADIGTGESDLTWQATAGIGYTFSWGDLLATWRYLGYEFKSGSAIEKLRFSGPVFGAAFRF